MKKKTKSAVSAASVAAVLMFSNSVSADCKGGYCKPKTGKPKTHLHVNTDWNYYSENSEIIDNK